MKAGQRHTVKFKLALWLGTLTAVLAILLLIFMLWVSDRVAISTAISSVNNLASSNINYVSKENDKYVFANGFRFYTHGITVLAYSKSEALVAGQPPIAFTAAIPFQNGLTRAVDMDETQYIVNDMYLPFTFDDGVWLRTVTEVPDSDSSARNVLVAFAAALPLFTILACIGGYWIIKRCFQPLDKIANAVSAISEGKDLSMRINMDGSDEFARLASAFDDMAARLEHSFDTEKQFTADASHELRTPIAVIKSACEYAEKFDETAEDRRETIETIHRQADKMSTLVTQLLSITRLDQGTEHIKLEKNDLGELVRAVCLENDYGHALHIEAPVGISAFVDKTLLSRLIKNLIDNAFKYGKPDGNVWISVNSNEDERLICVRDDGIGISDEHREKIWRRFYQADSSHGESSGAGLGLYMVKQIAHIHGGYMTLESQEGVGSEFTLHLPVKQSPIP